MRVRRSKYSLSLLLLLIIDSQRWSKLCSLSEKRVKIEFKPVRVIRWFPTDLRVTLASNLKHDLEPSFSVRFLLARLTLTDTTQAHVRAQTHTHHNIDTHIHACKYICLCLSVCLSLWHTHARARVRANTQTHWHTHTRMHARKYLCLCLCLSPSLPPSLSFSLTHPPTHTYASSTCLKKTKKLGAQVVLLVAYDGDKTRTQNPKTVGDGSMPPEIAAPTPMGPRYWTCQASARTDSPWCDGPLGADTTAKCSVGFSFFFFLLLFFNRKWRLKMHYGSRGTQNKDQFTKFSIMWCLRRLSRFHFYSKFIKLFELYVVLWYIDEPR